MFCIILAVIAIIVRMYMAKFKKNAVKMYYGIFILNIIGLTIYSILLPIVLDSYVIDMDYSSIANNTVIGVVYIASNIKYFKKRAYMFVN